MIIMANIEIYKSETKQYIHIHGECTAPKLAENNSAADSAIRSLYTPAVRNWHSESGEVSVGCESHVKSIREESTK